MKEEKIVLSKIRLLNSEIQELTEKKKTATTKKEKNHFQMQIEITASFKDGLEWVLEK